MAFSVSRFLPRDGINFLQERKKERSGISRSISRRNSSRRLAEVMGAKLFRPFYRSRGEIGVNIEVSKRIGKPATYNTVLVKLWETTAVICRCDVRGIVFACLRSRKKTCVAVARVHRVHKPRISPQISLQRTVSTRFRRI